MHIWPAVWEVACLCIFVPALLDPNGYRALHSSVVTGRSMWLLWADRCIHRPVHIAAMGIAGLGCIVDSVQMLFG